LPDRPMTRPINDFRPLGFWLAEGALRISCSRRLRFGLRLAAGLLGRAGA
jgi:hypothetical protein